MTRKKHPLRVFLCHSSGDKPAVRELYSNLLEDGIDAWLDEEKLIPGQDWKIEIPIAVKNSDVVIVCLSSQSINKEGFVQKEIKIALDAADEKPEGTIFIIPARLENCEVPERISSFHWVDLFSHNGYERLIKALKLRAKSLGIEFKPKKKIIDSLTENYQNLSDNLQGNPLDNSDTQKSNSLEFSESKLISTPKPTKIEGGKIFYVNFADEKSFKSSGVKDIGKLKIEKHIKFSGIIFRRNFMLINQISIVHEKLKWGSLLSSIVLNIFFLAFIIFLYMNSLSITPFFTLIPINELIPITNSTIQIPYLVLLIFAELLISSMIIVNIIFLVLSYNVKWMKIDYEDENGFHRSAYFSVVSFFEHKRNSEKLYQALTTLKYPS